jgi:protein-histidine pros-kinase
LIAVAFYLLLRKFRSASAIHRTQIAIILFSTFIPLAGNLLYTFFPNFAPHLDTTPFLLTFQSLVLAFGLLRHHILDLTPIAREKLADSLSDGMIVLDLQNRIVDINQVAAQAISQATTAPLSGQNLAELAPPIRPFLALAPAQEIKTEIEAGTTPKLYFDVLISPVREPDQSVIGRLIVFRDITKRKHTENLVRESENRLRSFLETAPDPILIVDEAGYIIFANQQSTQLFQYSVAELHQLKIERLVPAETQAKHAELRKTYHTAPHTRPMGTIQNLFAVRKDGKELPVEVSLSPLQTPDGLLIISIVHDITARKQVEELREHLIHTLVHDLRNPLANIRSALELTRTADLEEELSPAEKDFIIGSALASTDKMKGLINNILDVHRLERNEVKIQKSPNQFGSLVNEIVASQLSLAKQKQITLVTEVSPHLPAIPLDPTLIARVLQNLIGNALNFTPAHGYVYLTAEILEGNKCRFSVRDTGDGIAADVRERLFQKFATTQQAGHGTGLGLAFCKLVIEAHGGEIWVESEAGQGAKFIFTLPLTN